MLKVKILTILSCFVSCFVLCTAEGQDVLRGDAGNTDADQCLEDDNKAKICMACSSFSFDVIPSVETCCSDKTVFLLCEACVKDRNSCETFMSEIEDIYSADEKSDTDDFYDGIDDFVNSDQDLVDPDEYSMARLYPDTGAVEKRFGKLFVNRNPKRFGKIFFGKRSYAENDDDYKDEMEKRFGRVFMGRGSYFGKRGEMEKRYGRLFTTSNHYFGKRAPYELDTETLDGSYSEDQPENVEVSKRYGRIYMGNRKNKMFGKRYGRIFFGKRSSGDIDKRYGTLYMGGNRYFMRRPSYSNIDKRYGRLFTGGRKYYFGK